MVRKTMRGRRLLVAPLLAVAVAALAACEPMPHTQFTQRAAPGSGANLALLSGNGAYVVLTATAAGPVVPGAGNWLVERATGDTVALPAGTPGRISTDGARVLLTNGGIQTLWNAGVTSTPTGLLSPDLTARAFVAGNGTVQTQNLATGVVRPVETGFPRPAGTATVHGVSDDGDTVVFQFGSTIRTIDLGAAASFDLASAAASDTTEVVLLAAGGTALARTVEQLFCDPAIGCEVLVSTVELIAVPSGTLLASHDDDSQELRRFTRISDNGRAVWSYQERRVLDDAGAPGCPSAPFAITCVVAASLVELSANGVRVDALGAGYGLDLDVSANGRFAALSREQPGYVGFMPEAPVRVVDRLTSGPRWETLTGGPSTSTLARISDNGVVIATTSENGGWYDFVAP